MLKTSEVIAKLSQYMAKYGDLEFELFCLTCDDPRCFSIHHFRVIEKKSIGMSIIKQLNIQDGDAK